MKIYIKTETGKILDLDVDNNDKIKNVKSKINDLEGISIFQ